MFSNIQQDVVVVDRDVASVSEPRSRGRLEAVQRLASVSSLDASVSVSAG